MKDSYKNLKEYQIRRLRKDETIKSFDCGDNDLNDFILREASNYSKALIAATYVYEHTNSGKVVCYFSLANDKVSLADFNNKTDFNRFRRHRFVNEKRLKSYPAVKICRFGVDTSFHGMGIGSLLLDFIKTYFIDDNKTGCRFLVVDAYNEAVKFYKNNGFQHLKTNDESINTKLLYFDLNDYECN